MNNRLRCWFVQPIAFRRVFFGRSRVTLVPVDLFLLASSSDSTHYQVSRLDQPHGSSTLWLRTVFAVLPSFNRISLSESPFCCGVLGAVLQRDPVNANYIFLFLHVFACIIAANKLDLPLFTCRAIFRLTVKLRPRLPRVASLTLVLQTSTHRLPR
jgi:hypothetical protein